MKEIYTPYVRPDGIIVGIKGKAPEKPAAIMGNEAEFIEYAKALTAFIQYGHPFEDQEGIRMLLPNDAWGRSSLDANYNPSTLLPPIELDVTEVRQAVNLRNDGEWFDLKPHEKEDDDHEGYAYRTVLRIAKEEATETQDELWGEVYNNGILWYRQELIHEYLLKQFTIQRKPK